MMMDEAESALARSVGERIIAARSAARISQKKLAEMIGKGQGSLGHYEAGRSQPPLGTLLRIADLTNTTAAWLLGETEEFGVLDALDIEILRRWRNLDGGQKFKLIGLINTYFPSEPP